MATTTFKRTRTSTKGKKITEMVTRKKGSGSHKPRGGVVGLPGETQREYSQRLAQEWYDRTDPLKRVQPTPPRQPIGKHPKRKTFRERVKNFIFGH